MALINQDYYTVEEVADLFSSSSKSVRRWIKAGLLPAETYRRMLWIEKKQAHNFKRPQRGRGKRDYQSTRRVNNGIANLPVR